MTRSAPLRGPKPQPRSPRRRAHSTAPCAIWRRGARRRRTMIGSQRCDGAAQAAKAAAARAERELNELRRAEAGIEGELKADRADDVEARVAELRRGCAGAEARVVALEQEIGASHLLARELEAAESDMRERVAKPVIDRLAALPRPRIPERARPLRGRARARCAGAGGRQRGAGAIERRHAGAARRAGPPGARTAAGGDAEHPRRSSSMMRSSTRTMPGSSACSRR